MGVEEGGSKEAVSVKKRKAEDLVFKVGKRIKQRLEDLDSDDSLTDPDFKPEDYLDENVDEMNIVQLPGCSKGKLRKGKKEGGRATVSYENLDVGNVFGDSVVNVNGEKVDANSKEGLSIFINIEIL